MPRKKTTPKTYIVTVLDKSGSMMSCVNETIDSFNKHINDTIKRTSKDAQSEVLTTLVVFNEHVDIKYINQPANHVRKLTHESYSPEGSTALYDAVGTVVDVLKRDTKYKDKNNRYIHFYSC